ncbi:hypothetical protein CVT25_006723 [Psilocybe cyanescens]|uniref:FHA domain-containing protein n=1 Tax=Psilocybe cyanescens TaxID=93625 RepID=A0A409X461_PSICY|nr:hypothetical protein CVT25_006723 [Psilocybe cyanescens]
MDTSGFNQIGRYGTLSLLKKQSVPVAAAPTTESNAKPKDAATSPGPQVITSFGIDSANLTFGSSLQCDVRLYYPAVDAVHCRLINEDGKAFLVVQGKAGAFIDGYWVYPNTSSSSSSTNASEELQQTITPLANNSEFEIHSKRFRFTYPPKDVRRVLLATPVAQRNRTLRLSMIQSAQVFTPRPSKDPRENLKILQSPIKTSIFGVGSAADASARDRSTSPHKPRAVSPLKFGVGPDDESSDEDMDEGEHHQNSTDCDDTAEGEEEEHIVLAHTNHPRVVEEDRDLVILEDVPLHLVLPSPSVYAAGTPSKPSAGQRGGDAGGGPPGTPTPMLAQPQPQSQLVQPQPPRTPPRRKSLGGTALHRAVLIRSAQRAVWRAEKEREEEEEEMEVLDAVVALGGKRSVQGEDDDLEMGEDEDESESEEDDNDEEREQEQEDVEMRSVSDDSDSLGMENDTDEERDEKDEERNEKDERKPLWKKSLERIIPWPFGAKKEDGEEEHVDDNVENEEEERANALENDEVPSLPVLPQQQQTPIRRVLGSFMTPQARQPTQQPRKNIFPTNAAASSTSHPAESSAPIPASAPAPVPAAGPGRYSLGGGEARRVLVQQPWRVKDLVVPPLAGAAPAPSSSSSLSTAVRAMDAPSTPDNAGGPGAGFPSAVTTAGAGASSASRITSARPSITQEERKAIQERRRSAVREVREDSFWKDGAPGMSPSKSRPGSSSPIKAPPGLGLGLGRPSSSGIGTPSLATPRRGVLGSPTKGRSLEYAIPEADAEDGGSIFLDKPSTSGSSSSANRDSITPSTTTTTNDGGAGEDDDSESTAGLFERMRETVEDMKRRRSIATLSTPRTTLLDGEDAGLTAAPGSAWRESVVRGSVKKLDFTKITPAQSRKTGGSLAGPSAAAEVEAEATPTGRTQPDASSSSLFSKVLASKEDVDNQDDDAENGKDTDEPEPFSLLRPGARASMSLSPKKRHEFDPPAPAVSMKENKEQDADAVMHSVPIVVVEEEEGQDPMVTEEPEETEIETKTRGRTRGRPRLLRAPKEPQEVADKQPEEYEQEVCGFTVCLFSFAASRVAFFLRHFNYMSLRDPSFPHTCLLDSRLLTFSFFLLKEHTQSKSKSSAKPASKTKPPSSSKPRSRAAKSPVPTPSPQTLEPEPSGSGSRRHRSRTPQPRPAGDEIDAASEAADVEQAPTRSGARRAARKGTAEPEEPPAARRTTRRGTAEPEEPQAARRTTRKGTAEPEEPAVVAPPKRKGRKVEPEPEPEPEPEAEVEEEVVEKVKPIPKRGRKPRAAATPIAAAIEEEDEAEEKEEIAPAPATVKRGRSKKGAEPAAPAQTAQEDEDEDEFDSYEVSTPAAAATTTTTAKKPSRVPGRLPTVARGRKAAEVAQAPEVEEEAEREEPVPLAATRGGRGARANTLKTPAPPESSRARIPASNNAAATAGKSATGTSRKPRGPPKTPASAPAAAATTTTSTSAGDGEKENARSAGLSGSANASDEEPVTKVRISRKTAAATTGAVAGSGRATKTTASKSRAKAPKVEQNDDDALETIAAGKTRTTRIMRTRTKTG